MVPRSILKMLLCAAILLAVITTANAAAPADEAAPATAGSFHTYLMPDLSLKSAFMIPLAPRQKRASREAPVIAVAAPPPAIPPLTAEATVATSSSVAASNSPRRNGPRNPRARLRCPPSREAVTKSLSGRPCSGGTWFPPELYFSASASICAMYRLLSNFFDVLLKDIERTWPKTGRSNQGRSCLPTMAQAIPA
jgi:hypothetical protein